MNWLSTLFAKRYLFSRKSHAVINIISGVSAFAVGVPVAAMIILLSVFNGFEKLVKDMYGEFDPDLMISLSEGKIFTDADISSEKLLKVDGVVAVSAVLEDNALLEYRGRQFIGSVRGVDDDYPQVIPVLEMVTAGEYRPWFGDMPQALVGEGVAYNLGINTALYDPLKIYIPRRGSFSTVVPVEAYREGSIHPSGFFALDADTDGKYVIVPLDFVRVVFDYPDGSSALMVKISPGADPEKVGQELARIAGSGFKVLTRYQQKASLYQIMSYEKWGIFLIILMVMVIASFAIVGSLVMLIIDKRSDLRTVITMGGDIGFLRGIFVKEGMLISCIGAVGGLVAGLLVCWLQQSLGLVTIPADTFLVDTYPVVVKAGDVAVVAFSFIAVCYIITKFTVIKMIPRSHIRI